MTFKAPPMPGPSGLVAPFDGNVSNVPPGWAVCDGNNGTPDLRDKFVKATSSTTASPGGTGGQNSYTLSTAQLPSHAHSGSTSSDGLHDHHLDHDNPVNAEATSNSTGVGNNRSPDTTANGSHSHTGGTLDNAGAGNSVDSRPAFYELLFIKKL